ncbi:MAG: cell wall hydrolase [Lachnospiraceae bacterium]|nr:cell wall hydrolase [Lachnospiraceae bacterium]
MKRLLLFNLALLLCLWRQSLTCRAEEQEKILVYTSDFLETITFEEFDMVSQVITAEAEGEDWEAQWYIACVILNRVESDLFPDSIEEVIFQEKQFSCIWNGRYDRSRPNDSCMEALQYALDAERIPEDIYYFTSNGYLPGTKPYIQVGDMYFSRQKEGRE